MRIGWRRGREIVGEDEDDGGGEIDGRQRRNGKQKGWVCTGMERVGGQIISERELFIENHMLADKYFVVKWV